MLGISEKEAVVNSGNVVDSFSSTDVPIGVSAVLSIVNCVSCGNVVLYVDDCSKLSSVVDCSFMAVVNDASGDGVESVTVIELLEFSSGPEVLPLVSVESEVTVPFNDVCMAELIAVAELFGTKVGSFDLD